MRISCDGIRCSIGVLCGLRGAACHILLICASPGCLSHNQLHQTFGGRCKLLPYGIIFLDIDCQAMEQYPIIDQHLALFVAEQSAGQRRNMRLSEAL